MNFGRDASQCPSLERYAAVVVLGSPMNADQIDDYPNLRTEVEFLGTAVDRGMPVPGICLGAQLLAKALGGTVTRCRSREQVYGLQFHLEVDRGLIERWLTVPANQPMLEAERDRVRPELIREQVLNHVDELGALSRETLRRWIDRFERGAARRRYLPSR